VARVVNELGGESFRRLSRRRALGAVLEELIRNVGVMSHQIHIDEPTRVSHVVFEETTHQEYRFTPEGPRIAEHEWQAALGFIKPSGCRFRRRQRQSAARRAGRCLRAPGRRREEAGRPFGAGYLGLGPGGDARARVFFSPSPVVASSRP
jgi:hypothetical protein